jgi:hypothetical protein
MSGVDDPEAGAFVRGLSRLLGRRARVHLDTDGSIAVRRAGDDGATALVIETCAAADVEARLLELAERGVGMVVMLSPATLELRVWDRFAWQFEERDVADPAECEALGVTISIEASEDGTRVLVVADEESKRRATFATAP